MRPRRKKAAGEGEEPGEGGIWELGILGLRLGGGGSCELGRGSGGFFSPAGEKNPPPEKKSRMGQGGEAGPGSGSWGLGLRLCRPRAR